MRVGMLRRRNEPTKIARASALACQLYDVEFFYFRPKDVDVTKKIIVGLFPVKNGWVKRETPYPDVVDNSLPTAEAKEVHQELEKYCYLTTHRLGSKDELYQLMETDGGFDELLIPYRHVQSLGDLDEFIDHYVEVILKPAKGSQGNRIFQVRYEDGNYKLETDKTSEFLAEEEMRKRVQETFKERKYLIQPLIRSKTREGHPYDIRMHVRRGKDGEWQVINLLPRIGMSNAITSNVNQGGGISQIDPFLANVFGDEAERVKEKLVEISTTFPDKLQKHFSFEIDALGIDIGLDETGKPWFFEVNTSPGPKFYESEIGEAKAQHYEYIIKTKLEKSTPAAADPGTAKPKPRTLARRIKNRLKKRANKLVAAK
ncbi:YheC/YheD family protein [Salisediminibacterium halotolerans]|uniref:UDP-N-acetylmuramoyl-tripeptide--D-alanyl-D-alanine ligase n=1 Tax=Salisediminibacterium halotolerans TaxID=517425 RepID=A0A1H9TN71_9BACI|nr:YheC/YheD family protein [Salisediminibacterium haloalkalitolerans]SER98605.1 UDP-N-acetylmuramoyl-tripeptide--D-alanyl-D-alanine ligase [Salisediminibacterium haloalkalitolerans]